MDGDGRVVSYGEVLRVREFRALWGALLLSRLGDQLAAVALSLLVYERTGSPLLTAATYAVTFLPVLVGAPLLAGLADALPRRELMVGCDVARALLVAAMALPGVPVAVLLVLLFLVALLDAPFTAARAATTAAILTGERYVVGAAVVTVTGEAAQVLGFLLGGLGVLLLGTQGALLANAGTYALSALLLRSLAPRPAAGGGAPGSGALARHLGGLREGGRLVLGDPALRRLATLAWLSAAYVVPEALAVPYAGAAGGVAVGLLLAANPLGTVVGSVLLARLVPAATRLRLMGPLALLACLPLVACLASPPWPVVAALLVLSGLGSSYNLPASAAFVAAVPDRLRGTAFGVVGAGMAGGQGLALVLAGALAEHLAPGTVMALAGALGCLVALRVLRPGAPGTSASPAVTMSPGSVTLSD
ncbi:MFS transporter [Vallicoccus soli]|uniref:MFS transporter n=1 Tax=Vallicoccus soli TaxID=2339232 RepID=A0A3A3YSC7_9ACTN|nr:MFS transporter [Vallicoccus soli]RJK94251.1 MFS transporter [Vallicoccus soli]